MRAFALLLTLAATLAAGCWHPAPRASSTPADRYQPVGLRPENADRTTPPAGALAVGARAPTHALRTSAGEPWTLAGALAGHRRVVVVFYRGDWSSPDVHQLERLEAALPALAERGAALVAVSVDSPETGAHLAAGLGLTFPIVSDPGHRLIAAFGVFDDETEIAWPSVFVVDAGGAIAWRKVAAAIAAPVTAAEVTAALDRLDGKAPAAAPPTAAPAGPRR